MVLDGRAHGVELWGYRALCDILVVWRKGVSHETEGTDPDASADIDVALDMLASTYISVRQIWHARIGVEHRPAGGLASHRLILEKRSIWPLLEGSVNSTDRDNKSGRFLSLTVQQGF